MTKTCPRCRKELEPLRRNPNISKGGEPFGKPLFIPWPAALSRHDNETAICSDCGMREAFEDSGMAPAYAGEPYWMTTGEEWLAHRTKTPNQG
jgi:hypothetical protein